MTTPKQDEEIKTQGDEFEKSWKNIVAVDSVRAALEELEKINTGRLAARGLSMEATAVSGARVHLDGFFRVLESKAQLESTPPDQTEEWREWMKEVGQPSPSK